jgi:hypothetical protein
MIARLDKLMHQRYLATVHHPRNGTLEERNKLKIKKWNEEWSLSLLRREIESVAEPPTYPFCEWMQAFAYCSKSMGFNGLRLTIDAPALSWQPWLYDIALPLLPAWRQIEAETSLAMDLLIFVPENPEQYQPLKPMDLPQVEELHWRRAAPDAHHPLQEMVQSRYEQLCKFANVPPLFGCA